MARRPLYGGSQGIPRGYQVDKLLPKYAFTDFKHDFSGDAVTPNVLNDIETQGSRASFFKKIEPLVGKDVYQSFKSGFMYSLPVNAEGIGADGITEEALLAAQGIPYADTIESVNAAEPFREFPVKSINVGGIIKNYSITNVVEKPNWAGVAREYVNLLSCLWAASHGKVKFAIMYDAGVVGTSKIASMDFRSITDLFPGFFAGKAFNTAIEYEIYFINSSENVRDPAPKIVERTFDKKSRGANVSVYFLNDYGHHAQYKTYVSGTSDQNSNLYSAYTLTTVRDPDTDRVRGTITYEDQTSEQLDDVKHESEIGSCTTRALSKFLKSPIPTLEKLTPLQYSKVMSSFMLKRSGDWCQALCLLDKQRVYSVSGYESAKKSASGSILGTKTTLQELENNSVEIMLMTHDRVLLTYGITLGVNVCFTNNRPTGHWITYFKNSDIFRVDDQDAIVTEANTQLKQLVTEKANTARVRETATSYISTFNWSNVASIIELRRQTYILANLIPSETFDGHSNNITDLLPGASVKPKEAPLLTSVAWKAVSDTLGKLRTLLPNVNSTLEISRKLTTGPVKYPDQDDEAKTFENLKESMEGSRPFKSSQKNTAGQTYNLELAFTVLAERLIDDIRASEASLPSVPSDDAIAEIANRFVNPEPPKVASRSQIMILRSMFDTFRKAAKKANVGVGQTGGGPYDANMGVGLLATSFYLMTRIAVPIIPPEVKPDTYDSIGFPAGSHITHYDGWRYYVYDNYIVTKEFEPGLLGVLATVARIPTASEAAAEIKKRPYFRYIVFRYLLVSVDILKNECESLAEQIREESGIPGEIDERVGIQEKTWYELSLRAARLGSIINELLTTSLDLRRIITWDQIAIEGVPQPPTSETINSLYANLMILGTRIPAIGIRTYQLETAPDPARHGGKDYVCLMDDTKPGFPAVGYQYDPKTSMFYGDYILYLPEAHEGFKVWQNIATGVYVPLAAEPDATIQTLYGEKAKRKGAPTSPGPAWGWGARGYFTGVMPVFGDPAKRGFEVRRGGPIGMRAAMATPAAAWDPAARDAAVAAIRAMRDPAAVFTGRENGAMTDDDDEEGEEGDDMTDNIPGRLVAQRRGMMTDDDDEEGEEGDDMTDNIPGRPVATRQGKKGMMVRMTDEDDEEGEEGEEGAAATKNTMTDKGPGIYTGGVRPRRPLYSNAEGPHLLTDIDPAQRKRRKTRRVRKPTSKSRRTRTV